MIPRSRSRTEKQDATAHQWPEPSNQGTYIIHINHLRFLHSNTKYRLDVHEDIEKNVVTATFEFPGFSNDEVQINFQNGKLTVSAETNKSEEHAQTGYTLRERLNGRLSRTLQLPEGVQVCLFLIIFLNEY